MKPYLKTVNSQTITTVDSETGEILDNQVNETKILIKTREEFFLMYSSMLVFLKGSNDIKVKLLAVIIEKYSTGVEFPLTNTMKQSIAEDVKCSPTSLNKAITDLVNQNIIFRVGRSVYKLNPLHVFKGSTTTRAAALKATLELECLESANLYFED